jgi:hypothetical protein
MTDVGAGWRLVRNIFRGRQYGHMTSGTQLMPSDRLKLFISFREKIAAATAMMPEANVTRKLM